MKYYIILLFVMLSCCSTYTKTESILPEPSKPKLSHIVWGDITIEGKHYFSISDSNMDLLNNNLIDLFDYERKQQLLLKYYEGLQNQ